MKNYTKCEFSPSHSVIRSFSHSVISSDHSVIRSFSHSVISPAHSGFTIIELLVASLLLGLLVTILTMIFNQSSIAWRTGIAGTVDMDKVRENIAELREEADNAFVHEGQLYRITGLWDKHGQLRNRACDAPGSTDENESHAAYLRIKMSALSNLKPENFTSFSVGDGGAKEAKTYTVNVMSGGPNNDIMDWEAIWSFPDDFDF